MIDPHGVGAGASGGIVGALAPHTPENWNEKKAFQFESLIASDRFWGKVDALSGLASGYGRTGRLQPVADDRALDLARRRAETAADLWQGQAHWALIQSDAPWAPFSPTGWLIHDTLTARLHPRRACDSLAAALRASGVEILREGADQGAVIWATGVAGLRDLSAGRDRVVGAGVKGQALLLDHDARAMPQLFVDGLHIIPHDDGTTAIGSTSERDYEDPATTDAQIDDLHARAVAACPVLTDAPVLRTWAGVRPRARSRAPMLGQWPARPGHFIANGGFKIGFGVAVRTAVVMAGLVLDGRDTIPPEFRVEANF